MSIQADRWDCNSRSYIHITDFFVKKYQNKCSIFCVTGNEKKLTCCPKGT